MKVLKNNLIFLVGTILFVYKALLLNYLLELQIGADVILYTILVSLLIMSPAINHKNKFAYIYLNIIYALVTIIIYANFLYYSYSTNFLSFYQIENLKYAKEIGSGVLAIINIKSILLFFADNILIALLSILAYKKCEKTSYRNKVLKTALIVTILLLNIIVIKEKINDIYISKGYNKSLIVQAASIYYYHYEDAKDYFLSMFVKEEVDEEKLKNIYNENVSEKAKTTKYTGIAENSNVIILQLESLNEYIIGKKVNGKEITPNLNKFFSENIYCSDMYNQGLGTTADSEFEMENSMYPLENGYVFQKYYGNTWLDIYTTLKNSGYYTSFMHPNTSTFWNREEVYKIGTSIFSEKDYSFIKGLGYVTSKNYYINGRYYNRENLKEINENEQLKKLLEKMQNEIYLSDTIIKNNLLDTKVD